MQDRFALADRLEGHYNKAKVQTEKIRHAVLAKVELVLTEVELARREG